jgi:hypothetical protein
MVRAKRIIADSIKDHLIPQVASKKTPKEMFDALTRKEELHFDSLWEECIQEEARVANREAVLSRDEDQALAAHTKGGRKRSHFQKETHQHKESHSPSKFIHKESHPPRRFQKFQKGQRRENDFSSYQCYHCDKMGHIANNCPARRE